jgi:hypothetical protein
MKSDLENLKPWLLEAPEGTTLIYAGTLNLFCQSIFCFFGPNCAYFDWDQVDVRNEEALAQQMAAKHLADFGTLQTVLIKSHEGTNQFTDA